jgi:hypothetical protein
VLLPLALDTATRRIALSVAAGAEVPERHGYLLGKRGVEIGFGGGLEGSCVIGSVGRGLLAVLCSGCSYSL